MPRSDEADRSAARDFVMARLLAAGSALAAATEIHAELAGLMVDPDDDRSGKHRRELLEALDVLFTDGAAATQAAMAAFKDLDPEEGEEEHELEEDDDDEEEEEDKDDDKEARPRRRRR